MKPIITTTGKSTQLRYELPHRAHDAKVYPVKAPNGSTIILYGHETGVGVVWRGGRPLKKTASSLPKQPPKPPPKVNGTSSDAIMIIDSDDDEPPSKAGPQAPPPAEFEDEEEELDPDRPYSSIIQQLRLSLNTEVLHVAVPHIPAVSALRSADTLPAIFSTRIVFTVACADFSVRVITLPLNPPSRAAKEIPVSAKSQFGEEIFRIPTHVGHQSIPRGVAMTWTSRAEPASQGETEEGIEVDEVDETGTTSSRRNPGRQHSQSQSGRRADLAGWDLLIASHSAEVGGLLKLWRFALSDTSLAVKNPVTPLQTIPLRIPATRIAFNSAQYPKRRHSQLLIADVSGLARIYDLFAASTRKRRAGAHPEPGAFTSLFRATFERPPANSAHAPILAARKSIIDAAWASDGHSIFSLLAEGEWGIWDVARTGPKPPNDPSAFSLRGFVGTSDSARSGGGASSPKSRSGRMGLVPMTPNTRRTKEETLFHGTPSSSSTSNRGRISIASLLSADGTPEDCVTIWYGSEVYRIANLGQFWNRLAAGNGIGSQLGPSLSRIHALSLFGESITSIDQFDTTASEARMAVPRDVLISTDHRLLIITNTAKPLGRDLSAAFEQDQSEEEETRRADRALLARGELDLGGMGRLIEDMEGSGTASGQRGFVLGNPRKVLFASSAS